MNQILQQVIIATIMSLSIIFYYNYKNIEFTQLDFISAIKVGARIHDNLEILHHQTNAKTIQLHEINDIDENETTFNIIYDMNDEQPNVYKELYVDYPMQADVKSIFKKAMDENIFMFEPQKLYLLDPSSKNALDHLNIVTMVIIYLGTDGDKHYFIQVNFDEVINMSKYKYEFFPLLLNSKNKIQDLMLLDK